MVLHIRHLVIGDYLGACLRASSSGHSIDSMVLQEPSPEGVRVLLALEVLVGAQRLLIALAAYLVAKYMVSFGWLVCCEPPVTQGMPYGCKCVWAVFPARVFSLILRLLLRKNMASLRRGPTIWATSEEPNTVWEPL